MKKICPLCETKNEEDARFCKKCNEPLNDITNNQNKEIAIVRTKKNSEKRHEKDPKEERKIIKKVEGIWNKFFRNVNKKQKIILAIFIPIILFFIAYTIAYYVSVEKVVIIASVTHKYYYPFDWQKTWYVWFLFLFLCGFLNINYSKIKNRYIF
ncbi:MAG: hypothetical protein RBT05_08925 [Bacteroidales bacterium]|jgi:uncharacterized membrane protein YvbJ|nr:hypothetical protein [Actinomycetota bacterium]MDX9798965.1 hypothetical protein [Bacteroidales bacterium]